jgi:hypothetical protein
MIQMLTNLLPIVGKFFKSKQMDVKLQEKIMLWWFLFLIILIISIKLIEKNVFVN